MAKPDPDLGSYKIEWIQAKNLRIMWTETQRQFNEKWAQKIAAEFDPDLFEPVVTTLPNGDGHYHIVDGQHRVAGFKLVFGLEQRVPCRVLPELSPAKAAHVFRWLQKSRKRVSRVDDFMVGVKAGDHPEMAIDKIVKDVGYRIGASKAPKSIAAVASLVSVFNRGGHDVLKAALQIIQATWGVEDAAAVNGAIIEGYGIFLVEYGSHVNWGRLKETVEKKYTPSRLLTAAKSRRDSEGGNLSQNVAGWLRTTYNKSLPENKKLKPKGS